VPRPARVVGENLLCDGHRLAEICAIKSSSVFGWRGAAGFATAFAATGLAISGACGGIADAACGVVWTVVCAACAASSGVCGGAAANGTGAFSPGGSPLATASSTGGGDEGHNGISAGLPRSCVVAIGISDR